MPVVQLTRHTNHALRLLMYCAAHGAGPQGPTVRLADAAQFYGLSPAFLHKVMQGLAARGYVRTARGRNGGVRLARDAGAIRLGDVVRDTEDRFELADCFRDDADCPLQASCNLSRTLHRALDAFFAVLDEVTIADLTGPRANINVLATLDAMTRVPFTPASREDAA